MMDRENFMEKRKNQEKQELLENATAEDQDVEMRSDENSSAEDSESDEPSGEELDKLVDEYQKQMKRRRPILKEIFGKKAGFIDFTEEEFRAAFAERRKNVRDLRFLEIQRILAF